LAGLLHDIGKIGVPDSILSKPGPLTADEWAQVRAHPEIGANLLTAPGLADVRAWILAHHERPDGTGYPFGLRGDAIPLEARILAVADAFEAIQADRSYRPGRPQAEAIAELRRCSGSQFDPEVVEALVPVVARSPLVLTEVDAPALLAN
jgi:HD-GYP domain-containing protein (c-di-GMP phosphodiesterase class II)